MSGVKTITFFALIFLSASLQAAELSLQPLKNTYSLNHNTCKKVFELIKSDKLCRPYDGACNEAPSFELTIDGKPRVMFEEVATNEYGYTQVYRSTTNLPKEFTIVYVNQFQGDRHPRLLETYKVDAKTFDEVLTIPPGPVPYNLWVGLQPRHPKETNATQFAELLSRGEKISDEWSPVIEVDGQLFLLERECAGSWGFGAYYGCSKVIKLTVKKLFTDRKTIPYCQMATPKK